MNKLTPALLWTAAACLCGSLVYAQPAEKKQPPAEQKKAQKAPPLAGAGTGGTTPHATTSTVVGPNRRDGNRITIVYGRPFIKHPRSGETRKIWGGLVPWGKPDRLGADEATLLITQKPLKVGETTIPAGAYTLYIIPAEQGDSQLAFSKKLGDWGVPVDVSQDVARVPLKKDTLPETVEQLTISVQNGPPASHTGTLKIAWENTQFSLPFQVQQ